MGEDITDDAGGVVVMPGLPPLVGLPLRGAPTAIAQSCPGWPCGGFNLAALVTATGVAVGIDAPVRVTAGFGITMLPGKLVVSFTTGDVLPILVVFIRLVSMSGRLLLHAVSITITKAEITHKVFFIMVIVV